MSREARTVKVREIQGEPMRYRVESWNDPANPHTVDLSEAGGLGICSCRDCQTTVARNRKRFPGKWVFYGTPEKPNRDRTLCRHIEAGHKRYLMTTLPAVAAQLHPQR